MFNTSKQKNGEYGFTLPELMIAVLLLCVALVPIMDLFSLSGNISAGSWFEITAVNLAQSKLEEIKDLPFADVQDKRGIFVETPGYEYQVKEAPDRDYPSCLKSVTVSVYYNDSRGAKTVELTMEKMKR